MAAIHSVLLEISLNQPYVTANVVGLNWLVILRKTIVLPEIAREVVASTLYSEDLNLLFKYDEINRPEVRQSFFIYETISYAYDCEALTG